MRTSTALLFGFSIAFVTVAAQQGAPLSGGSAPLLPQQPSFRTGVELVTVDVQALDKDGHPVEQLTADDFRIEVDGKPRPVSTARFVRFVEMEAPREAGAATDTATEVPERGFATNDGVNAGRLIALIVDQGNMTHGGGRVAMEAAGRFLDRLTPADRIGLLTIPVGPSMDFTNDFAQVRQALLKIVGGGALKYFGSSSYNVSLAESFAFVTGQERRLWNEAVSQECSHARPPQEFESCRVELEAMARDKVLSSKASASISLQALRNLLRRLATIEGPKQLVFIGQNLVTGTTFGDLDLMPEVNEVGLLAQHARATVSVLHEDRAFLEAFDVRERFPTRTPIEDTRLLSDGLVQTAGASGGAYYNLAVKLDPAFDRIARETSAAYEVGFETIGTDRDGKPHKIEVKVLRPGVTVRARRSFVAGPAGAIAGGATPEAAAAPTPADRVKRILESPVPRTGLPIRLRAHALGEPGGQRVRVLVTADIGRDEKGATEVSLGYFLRAPGGAIAGQAFETVQLPRTERKTLYYSTVLMVPPGEYLLRLGAVDASERAGLVETPVTARFESVGPYEISDPLLIEPDVRADGKMKMNVDGRVRGHQLSAYVELRLPEDAAAAQGSTAESTPVPVAQPDSPPTPNVRFDLLNPADGTVLAGRQVTATADKDPGRWFAETTLDVSSLPSGRYSLRIAPIDAGTGEATKGMTRTIVVAR